MTVNCEYDQITMLATALYLSGALQQPVHRLGARVVELLLGVEVRHLGDHVNHLLLACARLGQEGHLEDGEQSK